MHSSAGIMWQTNNGTHSHVEVCGNGVLARKVHVFESRQVFELVDELRLVLQASRQRIAAMSSAVFT